MRKESPLRNFDELVVSHLVTEMKRSGLTLETNTNGVAKVDKDEATGLLSLELQTGKVLSGFDTLIWAIGRHPRTQDLGLEGIGVTTDARGFILTDEQQNTSVDGVYAVGDVSGRAELTPVAIAAGRQLAER